MAIYKGYKGHPREAFLEWKFPSGSSIKFSHLEHEKSIYDWQGSQIPLICCEINTKIQMGNNTLTYVKDLKIGDIVKNISTNNKIINIGEERQEECVLVEDSNGNKQIHSTSHKILTMNGWLSYEDVLKASAHDFYSDQISIEYCSSLKYDEYFHAKYQELLLLYDNLLKHLRQVSSIFLPKLDHQVLQDFFFCKVLQDLDNYFVLFQYEHLKFSPHILSHLFSEILLLIHKLKECISSHEAIFDESFDVQILLKLEDYLYYCSVYSHQYDERLNFSLKKNQDGVLQLNDVVAHSHIDQLLDGEDITQKYNRIPDSLLLYCHPYKETLVQEEAHHLHLCSLKITPIGKKTVKDITIENSNYYITENGLINKNCFDELTHFTESQFTYMLSRNRSTSGVKPYVRATCNPDVNSWVREWVNWYIDENGFAIPERSGQIRWFIRKDGAIHWANSKEEIFQEFGAESLPKSFTFISAKVTDNKILMEKDPDYLANLEALSRVDRERLLGANWNVRAVAGSYFQEQWFEIVDIAPGGWIQSVRYWDRAATPVNEDNKDPDWTRGLRMLKYPNGTWIVTDLRSLRGTPNDVEKLIKNTASWDGYNTTIYGEEDPGSAGKSDIGNFTRMLAGFSVHTVRNSKDKETRAKPVSAQSEAGNIKILRAPWNKEFFNELENFPIGNHDDIVDVYSGAFNVMCDGQSLLNVL